MTARSALLAGAALALAALLCAAWRALGSAAPPAIAPEPASEAHPEVPAPALAHAPIDSNPIAPAEGAGGALARRTGVPVSAESPASARSRESAQLPALVRGRVVAEGEPVAGAELLWVRVGRGELEHALSDADGAFRIEGDASNGLILRARKNGEGELALSSLRFVAAAGGELELELRPTHDLDGRVVDERAVAIERFELSLRPAGDVDLEARSPSVATALARLRTRPEIQRGEHGRFTARALEPGRWLARASADQHADSREVELEVPRGAPLELVAPRSAFARGVVVDELGAPVPAARVGVLPESGDLQGIEGCDAQGRFELELAPALQVSIAAVADGYARSESVLVDAGPGAETEHLVLALLVRASLAIEVQERDGAPCDQAEIELRRGGRLERSARAERGALRFDDLAPGLYRVHANVVSRDQRAWAAETEVLLEAGAVERVVLGGPGRRAIRVFGAVRRRGESVSEGLVNMSLDGGGAGASVAIGADGRYELFVDAPGTYSRNVFLQGCASWNYARVDVPDAEEIELDVDLPGAALGGVVLGPDGEPVQRVALELAIDPDVADLSGSGATGRAYSDPRGRFRFDALPAGRYALRTTGARLGVEEDAPGVEQVLRGIELREDEVRDDVELRLVRPTGVEGTVRDAARRPIGGARVVALGSDGRPLPRGACASEADGHWRIEALPPGALRFIALSEDACSTVAGPFEASGARLPPIELALAPAASIAVAVREPGGRPVGAALRILDAGGVDFTALLTAREFELEPARGSAVPAASFGPLPPGAYTLRAINHDRVAAERRASVREGERLEVELVLGE